MDCSPLAQALQSVVQMQAQKHQALMNLQQQVDRKAADHDTIQSLLTSSSSYSMSSSLSSFSLARMTLLDDAEAYLEMLEGITLACGWLREEWGCTFRLS